MSQVIPNIELDIKDDEVTFKDKIGGFLERLTEDIENTKKEMEFHQLIISTFEEAKVEHPFIKNLTEAVEEAEKFIKALEDREIQGKKLREFLNGEFVLDFDKFVFLMIDVLGSQMVNYVELKNEFQAVSEMWTTKVAPIN